MSVACSFAQILHYLRAVWWKFNKKSAKKIWCVPVEWKSLRDVINVISRRPPVHAKWRSMYSHLSALIAVCIVQSTLKRSSAMHKWMKVITIDSSNSASVAEAVSCSTKFNYGLHNFFVNWVTVLLVKNLYFYVLRTPSLFSRPSRLRLVIEYDSRVTSYVTMNNKHITHFNVEN